MAREQVIKFMARRLCRDILVNLLFVVNFIKKKKIHSCFKVCSSEQEGEPVIFSWKDLVPYSFIQTKVSLPKFYVGSSSVPLGVTQSGSD